MERIHRCERGWRFSIVGAVLCFCVTGIAGAAQLNVSLTRIASSGMIAPGNAGGFTTFIQNPAISDGVVVFTGSHSGPVTHGLYAGSGGALTLIANSQTVIPGSSNGSTFGGFGEPAIDGGRIAFSGSGGNGLIKGNRGIYVYDGSLKVYVNYNTFAPGSNNFFEPLFHTVDIDGSTVVFNSRVNGKASQGVYSTSAPGIVSLVADDTTSIPGGSGTFFNPSTARVSNGVVTYSGSDGQLTSRRGLYRFDGVEHSLVVDDNTVYPETGFILEVAGRPAFADGVVAFAPRAGPTEFVYRWDNGVLSLVADNNTPIPSGNGNFTDFSLNDVATGDGAVAFRGHSIAYRQEGIYIDIGGGLHKVVDKNDDIEGKLIQNFTLGHEALDNNQLAFRVSFTDGTQSIYRADISMVPLPSALVMLLFPLLTLTGAGRRFSRGAPGRFRSTARRVIANQA